MLPFIEDPMRINRRVCGLAAVACLAMTATACGGDGGEESVFLYFINGYPGTGEISVNGTAGKLVNKVPFGERFGADNTSCGPDTKDCVPVRVERQIGSTFTYQLENMFQPAEIEKELFSMYPQETGTLVLTQRSGQSSIETTLLRHTQSISSDCSITFVNGLSVSNEYLGAISTYNTVPEWYIEDIRDAGFTETPADPFVSECGALPTDDPTHENLQRPEVLAAVAANPWFFFGDPTCTGLTLDDQNCGFGWGVPLEPDLRSGIFPGGSYVSVLNSREYYECIQAAISIRQPDDMMTPVFPGAEVDCPTTPLTWGDVDIDAQAVVDCNKPIQRQAQTQSPAASDTATTYSFPWVCDARFRVRNEGLDIVFGPKGNDELGSHGDGELIESNVDIPNGAERFWVILGRPVNPIIWQWDSSEAFVNLENYPYFNDEGDRPVVGDYDF
jgi:hypothetical protein